MNPLVSGLTFGTLLAVLGFFLLWPVLGRELMTVFKRFVTVFLLKLGLAGLVLILLAKLQDSTVAGRFATGMLAAYLPLLFVQLFLFTNRLKKLEREGVMRPPDAGGGDEQAVSEKRDDREHG